MNVWDTFCIGETMDQVHGSGPEKGSMDPWSMFCPYPTLVCTRSGFIMKLIDGNHKFKLTSVNCCLSDYWICYVMKLLPWTD